jgi:hypothetical protein
MAAGSFTLGLADMMAERYRGPGSFIWIPFNKKVWTKRQARRGCVKKEQRLSRSTAWRMPGDAEIRLHHPNRQ